MRTRRLAGPALGVLTALALGVAGCAADDTATPGASPSSGAPAPAPSGSSAADPAAASALGQAAATLGTTSFKLTLTAGPDLKLVGTMDAPNGKGAATLTASGPNTSLNVETRLVGQDLYVQVPGVTKEGTWTRIDVTRLPEGTNLGLAPGQIDPANTADLLASTTDVRSTGGNSYAGSVDLTKVAGITGVDKVSASGTELQKVPFTAGLDEQGRLSELTVQIPAVNGQQARPLEVLYTDYGLVVDDLRPAPTTVVEAPADLYTTLGGK